MKVGKRAYRSRDINTLDLGKMMESVEGQRVVVATDVAKIDMVSSFELWDGTLVALVKWKNPGELRQFVNMVIEVSRHAEQVECVQEPTGTYGDPLRAALEQRGVPVFRASAKHVHDLREVHDGSPSSHDAKAARIIARLHRQGQSGVWRPDVPLSAERRSYRWFADEFQRLIGRLEARLARHWPEVGALLDLQSTTFLRVLESYGSPQAITAARAEAGELIRVTSRGTLKSDKIESVLQSAEQSVGVIVSGSEAAELQLLAREALRVKTELAKHAKQFCAAGNELECVQRQQTVVGAVTATSLFTLLGDPQDYCSPKAYQKAAGLNLVEHSSGKRKGQLAISKRGPGAARQLLYLAVMGKVQRDPLFKAWHERKVKRSGPREGKKSLVALARKLLAALWHVGRGSPFDARKLFNAEQLIPAQS